MVEVDGNFGEGGGQIVRTSLSLSCLYGIPFRIRNIRSNRKKPGLMRQHLTCVLAAARICGGEVAGAEVGASEFTFIPGHVTSGTYRFDIGTAGSTSLVLQTLIPPLLRTDSISRISITGGTHVPVSPTFHYLSKVFLPALSALGIRVDLTMVRPGFYPKGGGEIVAVIHPAATITPLSATGPTVIQKVDLESAVSALPLSIAERQREAAIRLIRPQVPGNINLSTKTTEVHAYSPGTFIFICGEGVPIPSGFSSIGVRGKPAETVGAEAAEAFLSHYRSEKQVDPHLADQLVIYLSLATGISSFSTSCITRHLLTNLHVMGLFREVEFEIAGREGHQGMVTVKP